MGDRVEVLEKISELVVSGLSSPNSELELSVGTRSGRSQFNTGVPFAHFKGLLDTLQESVGTWSEVSENTHCATYYFEDNIRVRYFVGKPPVCIKKTRTKSIDILCSGSPYILRISLSEELPKPDYKVVSNPNFVRLHQRWQFEYKKQWSYDLSKVATGTDKETACASLPIYEIELEYKLGSQPYPDPRQISENILAKGIDLIGRYNSQGVPIQIDTLVSRIWTA